MRHFERWQACECGWSRGARRCNGFSGRLHVRWSRRSAEPRRHEGRRLKVRILSAPWPRAAPAGTVSESQGEDTDARRFRREDLGDGVGVGAVCRPPHGTDANKKPPGRVTRAVLVPCRCSRQDQRVDRRLLGRFHGYAAAARLISKCVKSQLTLPQNFRNAAAL